VTGGIARPDLAALQADADAAGRRCCTGAVIFDGAGRLFVPRRAPGARMPGLWDIVGGHVEDGESLVGGLRREVFEETGWTVTGEPRLIHVCDWELPGDPVGRREFDFEVTVAGDIERPRLAPDEHDDFRWVGAGEIAIFDTNAGADQGLLRRIAEAAFSVRPPSRPARPHATVFLDPVPPPLAAARERWDPVMTSLIAPHVTIASPDELPDLDTFVTRVAAAAEATAPFGLRLGAATHLEGGPERGVFVAVEDTEGGWQRIRDAVVGAGARTVIPHVTVVHPRTSGLGRAAWGDMLRRDLTGAVLVTSIAVTAFDDGRWVTVAGYDLGELKG
jgi:8-oxo-dGTP pyrophosphatase MutT (NUDIX family)